MEYSTGFVDVQSSNNAIARRFSFPPSLKCPFCRQFLRALFDRLFSLAVIILPPWYIMQPSLWVRASARTHRVRCNLIFLKLGRENSYNFFAIRCSAFCPVRFRDIAVLLSFVEESANGNIPPRRLLFSSSRISRRATPWKFDIPAQNTAERMRSNFSRLTTRCCTL